MKSLKYILIVAFTLTVTGLSAQSTKRLIRKGNKEYEQNKFSEAEVRYKKALDKKPDYYKGKFNLGDAYYQEKNYKDADSLFTEVAATAKSSDIKAKAWFNKGNALMQQKKYEESIEAFKNALRLNPTDTAAKYNLEYARKKLKKQQQQKQQQQKKQNKQNKKNKDKQKKENKDKDKKNQKKQDKKNQEKNKEQQNKEQKDKQKQQQNQDKQKGKKGKDKQQKQQPKPQQISKQEAKRMLDALKNGEKKTLKKLQLQKAKAQHHKTKEIDW